jgi:hypothetical protein
MREASGPQLDTALDEIEGFSPPQSSREPPQASSICRRNLLSLHHRAEGASVVRASDPSATVFKRRQQLEFNCHKRFIFLALIHGNMDVNESASGAFLPYDLRIKHEVEICILTTKATCRLGVEKFSR